MGCSEEGTAEWKKRFEHSRLKVERNDGLPRAIETAKAKAAIGSTTATKKGMNGRKKKLIFGRVSVGFGRYLL